MPKPNLDNLWSQLEQLIRQAGEAILEVYDSGDFGLTIKDEKFPLTKADHASHDILMSGLNDLTPDLKIMSEESTETENLAIIHEEYYWCVDPLDGTAEFARKRDQFVVNIGLIGPEGPVAGMVYAPVFDELYWGELGEAAWQKKFGISSQISVSNNSQAKIVVGSISHIDEVTKAYINKLGDGIELKQFGSALKLTSVAKGDSDIYPRFAPTMEWDTAAPHAIVHAAGGKVLGLDGHELSYRKSGLLNPGFICYNARLDLPAF